MKFVICKTSGKRVNGKGIKYIGQRNGRQEGSIEINTVEDLIEILKNYGNQELIIYRTADFGNCAKDVLVGLPEYTIEIKDDWRE